MIQIKLFEATKLKKNLKLYRNLIIGKIYLPSFYAGPNETFLQATCLKIWF